MKDGISLSELIGISDSEDITSVVDGTVSWSSEVVDDGIENPVNIGKGIEVPERFIPETAGLVIWLAMDCMA